MTFVLPLGQHATVEVADGLTALQAARIAGVAIEGACGGSMACATCHVHVDPAWLDRLDPPSLEEEDMLDFASELSPVSRLACQIRLSSRLDGLVVSVPPTSLHGVVG